MNDITAVPPGCADIRLELEKPVDNIIFFAGEATAHYSNPQTVHGAIESGFKAAQEAAMTLNSSL